MRSIRSVTVVNICGLLVGVAGSGFAEPTYQESGGLVVMEAENTISPLGNWVEVAPGDPIYVNGATGTKHLEFTGNDPARGPADSPLDFVFTIHTPGVYTLYSRARRRLEGEDWDKCNDCYIRMAGDFTSGNTNVPLNVLKVNTKWVGGGGATSWNWSEDTLWGNGVEDEQAMYTFKAGETYTLTVSGRSQRWNVDRFVLRHETVTEADAKLTSNPESLRVGGTPPTVDAGGDHELQVPAGSAVLSGAASDDGTLVSMQWTVQSGPSAPVLSGEDTATLSVSGMVPGFYVFRLTATDDEGGQSYDEAVVAVLPDDATEPIIGGVLKQWHNVSLSFMGPTTSETTTPNPSTNYRMDVTFRHVASGNTLVVPGYYAANGSAGNGSASSGKIWRAHLAPNHTGTWSYAVSFRTGTGVATAASSSAGSSAGYCDGARGSFVIGTSDKTGRDFRAPDRGLIKNRGGHYLTFQSGDVWLKAGANIPENLMGYDGFDNTPNAGHTFSAHAADWNPGDPNWDSIDSPGTDDGHALVGALNFIAEKGANSIYFLPMNVGGDGDDTYPTVAPQDKTHFDVSKCDQWEVLFNHADQRGIYLHFILAETEAGNENYHDNGTLGPERKLYYRELIARFGHHLGVEFNIGEENDYGSAKRLQFAAHLKAIDPYDHPVTTECRGWEFHEYYDDLLGSGDVDITAFQGGPIRNTMANLMDEWRGLSDAAGVPWVISFEEPQGIQNDKADLVTGYTKGRRDMMWPAFMGGGGGFEWYVQTDGGGHEFDQLIDDFNDMDIALEWCGHVVDFLEKLPLQEMTPNHGLASGGAGNNYVLAKAGAAYAMYNDRGGNNLSLDLSGVTGVFPVRWFDPVNGGGAQVGTVPTVSGGGVVSLGSAPYATGQDWALLVGSLGMSVHAGLDQSVMFPQETNQVTVQLQGSVDAGGDPFDSTWSVVQAPGTVTFDHPTNPVTTAVIGGNPGTYELRLSAASGEHTASNTVIITVHAYTPDATPPTVVITSPVNGTEIVVGTPVTLAALVADDQMVSGAEFHLDGKLVGTVGSAPYEAVLSNLSLGVHTLTIVGHDTSGNWAMASAGVVVVTELTEVTQTFTPEDDVYIQDAWVANNDTLRVQPSGPTRVCYLKFAITGIPDGATIRSVNLALQENGDTGDGTLRLYRGSHASWTEGTLTPANAPTTLDQVGGHAGSVGAGQTIDVDVTPLVSTNGAYTVILKMDAAGSPNDIWFGSSESPRAPVLTVVAEQAEAGTAPLLNMASVHDVLWLTWWPAGAMVQESSTLTPPDWQVVTGATSPYAVTLDGPQGFYRVHM